MKLCAELSTSPACDQHQSFISTLESRRDIGSMLLNYRADAAVRSRDLQEWEARSMWDIQWHGGIDSALDKKGVRCWEQWLLW